MNKAKTADLSEIWQKNGLGPLWVNNLNVSKYVYINSQSPPIIFTFYQFIGVVDY